MKDAVAKNFLRPNIGGFRFSRAPDTTAPTAPILAQPIPQLNALSCSWINGSDPESGLTAVWAEISPTGAGTWTRTVLGATVASFVFSGLNGNVPYDVRIGAVNADGLFTYSAIGTATTIGTNPALEPGTVSFVQSQFTVSEEVPFTIGVQRVGAGVSSPAIDVDWSISVNAGGPIPSNGTISWAAGENSIKQISAQAASVTISQTGTAQLVAARPASGNIQPTIGSPSQVPFTIQDIGNTGVKWHPLFYMGTNNFTFPDDRKLANQITEQNIVLASGPKVVGWKGFYFPACLQGASLTVWDFSKIIRDYTRLANMSPSKLLMVCILPQMFTSGTAYTDLVPSSVYNNSSFGAAPAQFPGKYGFWTMNGKTGLTLAWWRPAVMDWVISLFKAFAQTIVPLSGLPFDQSRNLERTAFGETSMGVDSDCPDFSNAAVVTQYKRLIDAINLAMPNTLHQCNCNYVGTIPLMQDLVNYCVNNRTVVGGPDTYTTYQKTQPLTNGQAAALGVASGVAGYSGPDLRGIACIQADTQGPEISLTSRYTMSTPITFFKQVNEVLQQAHMVITYISGSGSPVPAYPAEGVNTGANPGNWNSFMEVINGNTLNHTQKPTSIP